MVGVGLRQADQPHHHAQDEAEDDVEQRSGERGRDAFPRFGVRQRVARAVGNLIGGGIDLRQVNVAAARNAPDAILHAVDLLAPDLLEADRKRLDVEAAEPRDDEMPELMHDDAQAEKDHHQRDRCDQDQCFHIFKNSFSSSIQVQFILRREGRGSGHRRVRVRPHPEPRRASRRRTVPARPSSAPRSARCP